MDGIIDSMDMSLSKLQQIVKDREAWHAVGHGVTKSQTRVSYLNNNNETLGGWYMEVGMTEGMVRGPPCSRTACLTCSPD